MRRVAQYPSSARSVHINLIVVLKNVTHKETEHDS
jgi:hypothetical protein